MNDTNNTLRLSQEFSEKFFEITGKNIEITEFSVIKDDIKNYRTLSDTQLKQIEKFTDAQKLEIIHIFNSVIKSIAEFVEIM